MKLIRAKVWIDNNFSEGSKPSSSTVAGWVKSGEVRGAIVGRIVFVDESFSFKNFSTKSTPKTRKELDVPEEDQLRLPIEDPWDKLQKAGLIR
jgi:hypothetical protein